MKGCYLEKWLLVGSVLIALFSPNPTAAQVVGDRTLPIGERSKVTGDPNFQIDGGARRGGNLFHSFSQFSVPTGGSAYFNNPTDVQNILARVTGGSISNIDGLIRANGTANLFLINPNGIIFGQNARLDIGGSFVGTTANAIGFGNQGFFSATSPNTPPLLTISPTSLLFNQIRAASIENNSVAPSGLNPSSAFIALGLRVPDGKSLLLVGGDIKIDDGGLFAFGGRVELGGLASEGTVSLNGDGNNLSLSFPDRVERSDVFLTNGAEINVTAADGGSIAFNARNLTMTAGSNVSTGIESGLGSNDSKAGNISVNATVSINLANGSILANQVRRGASGRGGDINISTGTLKIEGGAQVSTSTRGTGKGGSLRVNAQNVQLIGTSTDNRFGSSLSASANPGSTGDAGDLAIATKTLVVRDGAEVSASTFGAGKGGSLSIDAQDVQVIGRSANDVFGSALSATAEPRSTGDAGFLTIKTNALVVRDGAQVSAATAGAGKGGNLTIKTNTLHVEGGAQVGTNTFRAGKGGSLNIEAQDVQVIGTSVDNQFASALNASAERNSTGDAGDLTLKTNTLLVRDGGQVGAGTFGAGKGGSLSIEAQDVQVIGISGNNQFTSVLGTSTQRNSTGNAGDLTIKTNTLLVRDGAQVRSSTGGAGKGGSLSIDAQDVQVIGTSADDRFSSVLAASAQRNSTGNAGDLTIKTNTLLVRDGAAVTVQSLGTGTAGNSVVDANQIYLNNTGTIRADTTGGGGNIDLRSPLILLRNGSSITTNARGSNISGGNISINTDNLVAVPNENSDISANSANFRGGNVTVRTNGIFGIEFREQLTPLSDITATGVSSDFSGTVDIITPGIDPARGLAQLPTEVVDASRLVAQGCRVSQGSSFVVSGRGGLPPTPQQALGDDPRWRDWRTPAVVNHQPNTLGHGTLPPSTNPPSTKSALVEATGWVFRPDGKVILTASAPNATSPNRWGQRVNCNGS